MKSLIEGRLRATLRARASTPPRHATPRRVVEECRPASHPAVTETTPRIRAADHTEEEKKTLLVSSGVNTLLSFNSLEKYIIRVPCPQLTAQRTQSSQMT